MSADFDRERVLVDPDFYDHGAVLAWFQGGNETQRITADAHGEARAIIDDFVEWLTRLGYDGDGLVVRARAFLARAAREHTGDAG